MPVPAISTARRWQSAARRKHTSLTNLRHSITDHHVRASSAAAAGDEAADGGHEERVPNHVVQ
jgi:hypothetical protein